MRTNDRAAWAHAAARALSRSGRRMLSLTLSLVLALTLLPGMALAAEGDVEINDTNFPDANFQKYIKDVLDTDKDNFLSADEIAKVTELDVSGKKIADLTGIEHFKNLTKLLCYDNQLTTLDVSENKALTLLTCGNNQLTSLDVSGNAALTTLSCGFNKLESLDVSGNTALTYLSCDNNELTSLNVSGNRNLTNLYCGSNHLTSLDLSNTKVTALDTGGNQYTMGLKEGVYTFDLNTLPGEFDVDKVLKDWNLSGGTITDDTLTVNAGAEMVRYKYNCGIKNSAGKDIYADFRLRVHSADVHKIGLTQTETRVFRDLTVGYTTVESYNFYIRNDGNIPTGDLKVVLKGANASAFKLSDEDGKSAADGSISVSGLGLNGLASPNINYKPVAGLPAGTYTATVTVKSADENSTMSPASFDVSLTVKSNGTEPSGVVINPINFPDEVFRKYISDNCDKDNNGLLSDTEIAEVKIISWNREGITDLTGIQYFTELTELSCSGNKLTSLDVSKNLKLEVLDCTGNALTSLDVSKNLSLNHLFCAINQLTELDVSNNMELVMLVCGNNQLTTLDVSKNLKLDWLECFQNKLATLDVRKNAKLVALDCGNNKLTQLDLSKNALLQTLYFHNNELTALDVSNNAELELLYCTGNPLIALDLRKNTKLDTLYCSNTSIVALDLAANVGLKKLECNNNCLTSLNLSQNTNLTDLTCDGNEYTIMVDSAGTFDLGTMLGHFDASKASNWVGGTVSETVLTVDSGASRVTYTYSCGNNLTATFTLKITRNTGGGGTTPATPTQPAAPKLPFTDVSEDDWFYADAAYLYEKGVMKGTADETFAPGRSVTRGQLAAALYRMAGEPAVTAKAAFTDVPADYWCAAAITWAAESGVVTGYGDGGFRPADAVQRQELAAMLFRFAVYQGMSAVTLEENLAPFADRADVAAYAVPAMNWAVGQGILQGKDGSLLPQAPVDRAQLAAMLRRYLEK